MAFYRVTTFGCAEYLRHRGFTSEGELKFVDARRVVTPDRIKARVCERFGIRSIDMTSNLRAWEVSHPRQVAMYLARRLTKLSLPRIGRAFGNRDHTTVIHAIRQVEKRRAADPELDFAIDQLAAELSA